MSCALVAHGVLAYQLCAVQTLLPEEESHQEKGNDTPVKSDSKDKLFSNHSILNQMEERLTTLSLARVHLMISKGFADKPYTPPDLA